MLVFIDESGYPHPNDPTTHPVLLGVCIHERDVKPITNQIYKMKEQYFGRQDEIKATDLIRAQTISKNRTRNKGYVDALVEMLCGYSICIFAIIMDKPAEPICPEENYLPKQYHYLMKKVEYYCHAHHFGKAIFVFDETNEGADKKLVEEFTGFLFKSKFGKSFENILEMPLFVSSSLTPAIQIADICAGIVRHYYEHDLDKRSPEDDYEHWLCALFKQVYSKTQDNFQSQRHYKELGFQKMGSNFSYSQPRRR